MIRERMTSPLGRVTHSFSSLDTEPAPSRRAMGVGSSGCGGTPSQPSGGRKLVTLRFPSITKTPRTVSVGGCAPRRAVFLGVGPRRSHVVARQSTTSLPFDWLVDVPVAPRFSHEGGLDSALEPHAKAALEAA